MTSVTGLTQYAHTVLKKLTAGKNADAGLPFLRYSDIPVFTYDFSTSYYSYSKNSTSSSHGWTCRVYPSPWLGVCPCRVYIWLMPEYRTVRHPISPVPVGMLVPESVRYRVKRTQSGTGMLTILHGSACWSTLCSLILPIFGPFKNWHYIHFFTLLISMVDTITPRCGILTIALHMTSRARICKPFMEPRNRFPAWRYRFLWI